MTTPRAATQEEREIQSAHFDKGKNEGGPWDAYLWGKIRSLRKAAVDKVLAGLDHDEYLGKLGFIAALDEVLLIPRELDEQNETVKDSLNAG